MEQAYENAIVNVMINPVQDNSFFFNSGWGNSGYNYSNEYFQQTLGKGIRGIDNMQIPRQILYRMGSTQGKYKTRLGGGPCAQKY